MTNDAILRVCTTTKGVTAVTAMQQIKEVGVLLSVN